MHARFWALSASVTVLSIGLTVELIQHLPSTAPVVAVPRSIGGSQPEPAHEVTLLPCPSDAISDAVVSRPTGRRTSTVVAARDGSKAVDVKSVDEWDAGKAVSLLGSADERVVDAAIDRLSELGAEAIAAIDIARLGRDEHLARMASIVRLDLAVDEVSARLATPAVIGALGHPDTVGFARQVLERHAADCLDELSRALADGNTCARRAAAIVIGFGNLPGDVAKPLLEMHIRDPEAAVRASVLRALARADDEKTRTDVFGASLFDEAEEVRLTALHVLALRAIPVSVERMVEDLASFDPSRSVRDLAAVISARSSSHR